MKTKLLSRGPPRCREAKGRQSSQEDRRTVGLDKINRCQEAKGGTAVWMQAPEGGLSPVGSLHPTGSLLLQQPRRGWAWEPYPALPFPG